MLFKICYYLLLVFFCGNNLYAMETEKECNQPLTATQPESNTGGNFDNPPAPSPNLNDINYSRTKKDSRKRQEKLLKAIDNYTIIAENKKTEEKIFTTENISLLITFGLGLVIAYYCKKKFFNH